jgi:hypothetical protein
MKTVSVILFALAYLGALTFALRYLFARESMPYHAQVAGSWSGLDDRVRTVFIGLYRALGGALLGIALVGLWLTWLHWGGTDLPTITIPLPGVLAGIAAIWAGMILRAKGASPPIIPISILVLLAIVGWLLTLSTA